MILETPIHHNLLINGDKTSTYGYNVSTQNLVQAPRWESRLVTKTLDLEEFENTASDIAKPDHNEQLKQFSDAKARSIDYVSWMRLYLEEQKADFSTQEVADYQRLIAEVDNCGSWLKFKNYYTLDTYRLTGMISCQHTILCPACALRRAAAKMRDYQVRLECIKKEHPEIKAYFITFTVKDGSNLEERFQHLQDSIRKYHAKRTHAKSCKKHLKVEANKALGAVWSYQVKVGDGLGLYHPHCHAIWLCHDEPDLAQLKKEWGNITGDSHMCDVVPFYDQVNLVNDFLRVFRYANKFMELPFEASLKAHQALKGRRLIASFGLFRGDVSPVPLKDETLNDLPYYELFYRFG